MKFFIKDYDKALKVSLIVLCFVASIAIVGASFSFIFFSEPNLSRTFVVTGQGKVNAVPDVAQFSFSVLNQGKNVAELSKLTTLKANKVVEYLKSVGVDDKDITTTENAVEPNYENYVCKSDGVCPPSKVSGYTVRQSFMVKVRDFTTVGDILTKVALYEVDSLSQLEFLIDDKEKLQEEARAKAVKQAKEKAKVMAKSGGFRLGKLVSIYEDNYAPMPMYSMSKGMDMAMPEAASDVTAAPVLNVEPGSQDIVVNVNMTFAIK